MNIRWTPERKAHLSLLYQREDISVTDIARIMELRVRQVRAKATKLHLVKKRPEPRVIDLATFKEEKRLYDQRRYEADPDAHRAYRRGIYKLNPRPPEKGRAAREKPGFRQRERELRIIWAAANPEKIKRQQQKWASNNREAVRSFVRARRARVLKAPGAHTKKDIANLLKMQKGRCASPWCRIKIADKYHVDHVIPLVLGGSNDKRNIQLLCQHCNSTKWAKHPIDFAMQHGMLL